MHDMHNFLLQIDHHLSNMTKRIEQVLGKDWEKHVEGQKLQADVSNFRATIKQKIDETFHEWSRKVSFLFGNKM